MTLELRLVLAVLASYRLTAALVYDEGPWSALLWLRVKLGAYDLASNGLPRTRLGRLISCPHCVGVYTALLVALLVLLPSGLGDILLIVGAIAGAASWLHSRSGPG